MYRFVVVLVLTAFLSTSNHAAKAAKIYTFAASPFPQIFEDDGTGRYVGLAVEVLDRISAYSGMTFDFRVAPWKRALALAKSGSVSGVIGPYRSAEREQYLDYSTQPFYQDRLVVLTWRNWRGRWAGDLRGLRPWTVISIRGWAYGPGFEAARSTLRVKTVSDLTEALIGVLRDRTAVALVNERGAKTEIDDLGLSKFQLLQPPFQIDDGYFGFSKKRAETEFQQRFNETLKRLTSSGELNRLLVKYGFPAM